MFKMKKAIRLLLVAIMIFSLTFTCCSCGKSTQSSSTDGSETSTQTDDVEASGETEPVATQEPQESQEPAEDVNVPEETEESEEIELSGDYLMELGQEEMCEIVLSEYNANYAIGNTVTITMELEAAGGYNGSLGTCVGTDYAWEQTEFASEAGSYTLSWTIMPSVDMVQLGIWYSETGSVGVKSIEVAIEEVEVSLEGDFIKVLQMGDSWEMTLSDYNAEYEVGDYVNIQVTFESDGDFNGGMGACVGKDYEWQQSEFGNTTAGEYTFSWKVKPSTDMAQIGIWWVGGTAVGVKSVKVTIEEQPIGISGDYIALFTEQGYYEFSPYAASDYIFKFGDTIKVTVELESDGAFNGCMGTCVGSNYEWQQVEYNSETGISTWTWTVAPSADIIQVGIWWIDGTAVGIRSISVDMVTWGYQHQDITGLVYTATKAGDEYSFYPADYLEFNKGDIITIDVEFDSNAVYNGCLGISDANGVWKTSNYESNGGYVKCSISIEADPQQPAVIQFWWMNTKVAVNSITVTLGGEVAPVISGEFTYASTQLFALSDYVDYVAGDDLEVTVVLSSDGYFNGCLGASNLVESKGWWSQETFESTDGSAVTTVMTIPQAQEGNLQISVWWMEGSMVKVDSITAKVVEIADSDDDDGNDDSDDDNDDTVDNNYEFTSTGDLLIALSDYVDYVAGDDLEVTVILSSDGYFNGCVGASNLVESEGWWSQEDFESSDGSAITTVLTIPQAQEGKLKISIWWMEGSVVKVDSITAKVAGADDIDDNNDDVNNDDNNADDGSEDNNNEFTSTGDLLIALSDYADYVAGDDLEVTVVLSSDDYFNGCIGASNLVESEGWWSQESFESSDGSAVTTVLTITQAQEGNLKISIWWMEGSAVKVDSIAAKVL